MAKHTTIDSNNVIVTSDDGTDGSAGTPGGPVGGTGGTGAASLTVRAVAPAGSFLLGPSGTWNVQATSGNGGIGGAGGPGLLGGDGGVGGASGAATAILQGLTDSSFATGQQVVINVSAITGAGGSGGVGGSGVGANGADGSGGDAGTASVIAHTLHFTGITDLTLALDASGGNGGQSTGSDGAGGDANIAITNDKFLFGNGATNTLTIEAHALGGNGGALGSGGVNGNATIEMNAVAISGGAGFSAELIQIILNAEGGDNGLTPAGTASIDFSGNNFRGGGLAILSFSRLEDDSDATHDALTIDMRQGTVTLHDPGHGDSTSTFHHFIAVFGGAGDDVIIGGKSAQYLGGGGGADLLTASKPTAFIYEAASDSWGSAHDTITDLNFARDGFELPFAVAATDKLVHHADLSAATLNSDLEGTLDQLQSHHAVLVRAEFGDLAGHLFLVIDANGTVGYQGEADMVIDVTGAAHGQALSAAKFLDIS